MNVRFEVRESRGIITITGALNAASVDSFRTQLFRWMGENDAVRQIVLDLAAMDFIDSAGLGVIIAILKRVTEQNGDIRIANLQRKARVVFEITRAYKIFEIFDSLEEALKAKA
ncbi:MAG: STAS domain-containing protein [bacterium]